MIVKGYRSKVFFALAVKLSGTPEQAKEIVEWVERVNLDAKSRVLAGASDGEVAVEVCEGDINFVVTKGHWLVVKHGHFSTMSDDKFNSLYVPTGDLFVYDDEGFVTAKKEVPEEDRIMSEKAVEDSE